TRRELLDDLAVGLLAVLCAIEIDHVHAPRTKLHIAIEHARGIVRVHRFCGEVAFVQAHAAAGLEIDGGNQLHGVRRLRKGDIRYQMRMKLRNNCEPTLADLSGWNWAP